MKRILIVAVVAALALHLLSRVGLTPQDLWNRVNGEAQAVSADTKAMMSGEYEARVAERLRQETAKPAEQVSTGAGDDAALRQELAEERKRYLEQRAAEAEKKREQILTGDVESLKRQVKEQAGQAGNI